MRPQGVLRDPHVDIKNAFNSADCDARLAAPDGKDVPNYLLELIRDYFKDVVLISNADDCRKSYAVSAGVAQASLLGPTL